MSNRYFKEIQAGSSAWEKRAEELATEGKHFAVRAFDKRLHWEFLEDLCLRYRFTTRFDAMSRAVYCERD